MINQFIAAGFFSLTLTASVATTLEFTPVADTTLFEVAPANGDTGTYRPSICITRINGTSGSPK